MHFYLPRHRRPLLFPPGLLALAGLLWLGCVALRRWEPALRQYSVLRLTMPLRPSPASALGPSVRFELPSLMQVRAMGPWHNHLITGNSQNKLQEQSRIISDMRTMMADSGHHNGVRVSLTHTAHYKDLIFLIDLADHENANRYWLDIVHQPITFYAFTEIRRRGDHKRDYENSEFLCGNLFMHDPELIPSPNSRWTNFGIWAVSVWHLMLSSPLSQLTELISISLFLTIFLLGGWRIIGPRRATKTQ